LRSFVLLIAYDLLISTTSGVDLSRGDGGDRKVIEGSSGATKKKLVRARTRS